MNTKVKTEPVPAAASGSPAVPPMSADDASKRERRAKFHRLFLLFQDNEVGPIIGKGGCNIRAIKEKTGCNLSFFNDYHRNRTLNIHGPREKMGLAVREIANALLVFSRNRSQIDEKPSQVDSRIPIFMVTPHDMAISLIGKEGVNSKRIRDQTKASISVLFEKNSNHKDVLVKFVGTPEQLESAIDMGIEMIVKANLNRRQYSRFNNQLGYRSNRRNDMNGVKPLMIESRQSIKLNRDLAGVIIGRNGNTITNIRSYSGANVRIENNEKEESASVVVVGRPAAVARAFDKIEEILQSHMSRVNAENNQTESADGAVVRNNKNNNRPSNTKFRTTEAA